MAQSQTGVLKLYRTVIDDVITGVRDAFLDKGVDEQVLQELKQIWEAKLMSSKAVELNPEPSEPQPPQMGVSKDMGRNNISKPAQLVTQGNLYTTAHAQNMHVVSHGTQPQPVSVQQQSTPAPVSQPAPQTLIVTDPNKQVPIQITLPVPGSAEPRVLTIQVPASALQGNQLHSVLTGPLISATLALNPTLASTLLQQHVTAALQGQAASNAHVQQSVLAQQVQQQVVQGQPQQQGQQVSQQAQNTIRQVDGQMDTSDEEEDEDEDEDLDDDDENEDKDEDENEEDNNGIQEEEPLNSGDDVSDEDPTDLFDTDNVVVCQYEKITRSRNKWKFYLKDGIMNLNSKDFVFQKASGDAEW